MSYDFKYKNRDIVVTENGDIELATTKLLLARQWVEIRLKTILTEWFLDQSQGIDWFNLLSRRNTRSEIDSIIRKTIITTQYITKINSYQGEFNRGTRKYNVTFNASVEDGSVLEVVNLEI